MASAPSVPQTPRCEKIQIANADTTSQKTVITGATNGTKVVGLIASSTETASARDIQVSIVKSATTFVLGTKTVPLNSGFAAGVPAVNLLDPAVIAGLPTDADGQPYIFLETGDTLVVNSLVTVTSGKVINLIGIAADF
jgi:hypothetical protein